VSGPRLRTGTPRYRRELRSVGERWATREEVVADIGVDPRLGPPGRGSCGIERFDANLVWIEGGVEGGFVPGSRAWLREKDSDEHPGDDGTAKSGRPLGRPRTHVSRPQPMP